MKDLLQVIVFGGALLVLFLPIVVIDSMYFPFITGKNFYFRIFVEIIFGAWIILALLDVRFRPRLSWLLVSAGALLSIMLFANLAGEYPLKSFWSNFERMDGYVTLVHFFMYFVVLGSVLSNRTFDFLGIRTTTWHIFMVTALVAALTSSFFALQEVSGITESVKGWRLNATLGNAAYMAVYMLFNIFIAIWLIINSKSRLWQVFLGLITLMFIFFLVQTATRGTIVGLAGGLFVGAAYVALFNTAYPMVRKVALGGVIAVVLIAGSLVAFKDSAFVENNIILSRAANIGLSELTLRIQVWEMALQGAAERPVLGWGQGNFNYVFNEHYIPEIYYAELWYDRAHNVFMDWLVAGGILGLIAYLGIFVAAAYYLFWRPLRNPEDSSFTVLERGVLLGIVAGYFIHNLVVFDNIVSFIFFAIVLAIIHSRVAEKVPQWESFKPSEAVVMQVVAPVVLVATIGVVYMVNLPGMQAASDIIDAISAPVDQRLNEFDEALSRGSFGRQEIVEQLTQQAINQTVNRTLPPEQLEPLVLRAESELLKLADDKPGDARVHVFIAGFYRSIGQYDKAAEQNALARSFSPRKPAIVIDQGITEFQRGNTGEAVAFLKEAYELETANAEAQILYASMLLYNGENRVDEIVEEKNMVRFARNNFALSAVERSGDSELLLSLFEARIEANPSSSQDWATKAFLEYQNNDPQASIATLQEAVATIPEFAAAGNCFIANIEAGRTPDEGC